MSTRVTSEAVYLVSAAGVPNYGDEFVTRSWLDWLAHAHPDIDVWLDCIYPGRAAHLFRDTHPRLRTTSTVWELAHGGTGGDLIGDEERIRHLVRHLGTPRIDAGIETLREASSIHFLGGGYLNTLWRQNLGMLAAADEVKRMTGADLYATGQGLLPHDDESAAWMRERLAAFDVVESRDHAGAVELGVPAGIDDAFLAFANHRQIYAEGELPSFMLLVQGDFADVTRRDALFGFVDEALRRYAPDGFFGVVEGMPPDDGRIFAELRAQYPAAEFFSFGRIWKDGFPARRGQIWLTSRFHFHLLAAAAGASGITLSVEPGYYDIKHRSLLEVGTGWTLGEDIDLPERATADPSFPARVLGLAARKAGLAERLYPRLRVTGVRSALLRARGQTFDRAARDNFPDR